MKRQVQRLDAPATYFLTRELEHILEDSNVLYPEHKSQLVLPVAPPEGAGVTSLVYRMRDRVGRAKIIAGSARDLPRVDVARAEYPWPVKVIGDSFGWNVSEIESARYAGLSLDRDRADAAKEAIDEEINRIAFFGEATVGIQGFLNNSIVTTGFVQADGDITVDPTQRSFASKTPDQIIRDVNAMVETMRSATNGIETPNAILFPSSIYTRLATTPRSSLSDTTILNFLKAAHPEIVLWDWLNELETSGAVVSGNPTRRMVAYRKDIRKLSVHIPVGFTALPLQYVGLEVEIPCYAHTAGTLIRYPRSVIYRDGI